LFNFSSINEENLKVLLIHTIRLLCTSGRLFVKTLVEKTVILAQIVRSRTFYFPYKKTTNPTCRCERLHLHMIQYDPRYKHFPFETCPNDNWQFTRSIWWTTLNFQNKLVEGVFFYLLVKVIYIYIIKFNAFLNNLNNLQLTII